MSALSDLVKYAQMGDVVYSRGGQIKYYSRANEAAADLARLQAVAEAAIAFVREDGRGDPQAKYQVLKAIVEQT